MCVNTRFARPASMLPKRRSIARETRCFTRYLLPALEDALIKVV